MHTENQLPRLPGSALKVPVWGGVGWGGGVGWWLPTHFKVSLQLQLRLSWAVTIWMVAIMLCCASPTYSDPIQPVHCSALNVSKGDSPGCVSSTLLSPMVGKTIQIGGLPTPSTCMSACSAVHGEDTQALAVHRQVFFRIHTNKL